MFEISGRPPIPREGAIPCPSSDSNATSAMPGKSGRSEGKSNSGTSSRFGMYLKLSGKCCSIASRLTIDDGASPISLLCSVFSTDRGVFLATPRGSKMEYFLYGFSFVLNKSRELTEVQFFGRLPNPSSSTSVEPARFFPTSGTCNNNNKISLAVLLGDQVTLVSIPRRIYKPIRHACAY